MLSANSNIKNAYRAAVRVQQHRRKLRVGKSSPLPVPPSSSVHQGIKTSCQDVQRLRTQIRVNLKKRGDSKIADRKRRQWDADNDEMCPPTAWQGHYSYKKARMSPYFTFALALRQTRGLATQFAFWFCVTSMLACFYCATFVIARCRHAIANPTPSVCLTGSLSHSLTHQTFSPPIEVGHSMHINQ